MQGFILPASNVLPGGVGELGIPAGQGLKYGCGMGRCGACTSHIDGVARRTCITPMSSVAGHTVTTIDGLANGDVLHPVQQAWIENNVAQCGYCQAGQIMQAVSLVNQNPHPTDADIDDAMGGNLGCAAWIRHPRTAHTASRSPRASPRRRTELAGVMPDRRDIDRGRRGPSLRGPTLGGNLEVGATARAVSHFVIQCRHGEGDLSSARR
ncbi:MAG: isoquinoline 1-oxidoreductase subunit alpha [Actinomycetota bacterium]|jgi:aerobic-type carbon monoxide dehydrogenase small subunit (CoxS/CutS family)|nr:isoquinoline 1-oxidoreductase subunit alpha [Actinomycetota bacterium]